MRKYLWTLALCGAAGMAVPGWAQERPKSLFGLGRTSKPAATPAAAPAEKPAKPFKLKNYSELFGETEAVQATDVPSAKIPSPEAVQKMIAEADGVASSADGEEAFARNHEAKAPVATKTLVAKKAPVMTKTSLLDEFDELDTREVAEETAEEAALTSMPAVKKPSAARRPAPPADSEDSFVVRPVVKSKPPAQTAAADKHAWASEVGEEDFFDADITPKTVHKPAPVAKPDSQPSRTAAALTARPTPKPARTEAPIVARQAPKPPAVRTPTTTRLASAKPPVTHATNTRLNTPINVVSDEEEFAASEEISPVSASIPAANPARTATPAKSRVTISRSAPRSTEKPAAEAADSSDIASAYTAAASKSSAIVGQSPSVTVEWRSTGSVTVGQESTCELIVKNSGSANARDVEVHAQFPANVRLVSAKPEPASNANLVWEFDEIAPGEEKIVHVNFVPVERGEVAASADVRFTGAASTSFAVTEPLLAIKLEGTTDVMVGENASQTLMISNPGTGTAANVKVEALIPAGLEHARGERLSMELGNLAPGENRPIRLALTAVGGGRQVIEVHATADNGLVQSAASEVTVIAPSLAATIEGPGLRYLGRHATYKLHVANDGAAATDNVRVMHKIPDGFEFVSAERGAQYDPQNRMLNWFVGRLDRGAEAQVSVVLNAKSIGEFTHFVRATSEHGAISDTEVTTRIEGAASLVVDVLDLDDPVEVGVETAYEIRIKNEGTAPAANVGLTCELPAGMEFLTASGASKHANDNELVVFQSVAEVPAGKTLTYLVKVKGTLSGNMRFRTKVSSDSLAEPLASEEMTKIYGE